MREKRRQINARLVLGDDLIDVLQNIDDPEVARVLNGYLWAGVETSGRDDHTDDETDETSMT